MRVYLGILLQLSIVEAKTEIISTVFSQYFYVDIRNQFPMTKSNFKDISFLGVLKWVTVHNQTKK